MTRICNCVESIFEIIIDDIFEFLVVVENQSFLESVFDVIMKELKTLKNLNFNNRKKNGGS